MSADGDGGRSGASGDDADELGVNPVPGTISNGWAIEFLELDRFDTDERVSGERVLEVINGRGGRFLGTPVEALQTLLFVLVADDRIAIRADGERLTDTREIARNITSTTRFEDAIVVFDPSPPPEDLSDVYAALVGEDPDSDDTQDLLSGIETWATDHAQEFNTVVSRADLEFSSHLTMATLNKALKPAFGDAELDPALLTNEEVVEQADRYASTAPLFIADDGEDPLWDQLTTVSTWLTNNYPTASVTGSVSTATSGSQIPSADRVESLLDDAAAFRVETLQELSQDLTGSPATSEDIDTLRESLTETLRSKTLAEDIEAVTDAYPTVKLDTLQATIDNANAAEEPLSEEAFAEKALRTDAETLANGRALLETKEEGKSLHAQLQELSDKLPDDATGFVPTQIRNAVSGKSIPNPDRAQKLLTQGRSIIDGGKTTTDDDLWQRLSNYDDGTIVVIDAEDNQ